jgi:double-stranded uracil-DNA glycosylase
LSIKELEEGGRRLTAKVSHLAPIYLAVLGITAYRHAFHQPHAVIGPQEHRIRKTSIWVLPNPSGLNAHYQLKDFQQQFRKLRLAVNGKLVS